MTAKHTPGPWSIFRPKIENHRLGIESNAGSIVVWGYKEDPVDCAGVFGDDPEEAHANARLIAAAPDLLETLELVRASWELTDELRAKIEAVINKATK